MTRTDAEKLIRLALLLTQRRPNTPAHHITYDVLELHHCSQLSTSISNRQSSDSNYTNQRAGAARDRIRARLATIAKDYGIQIEVTTDPRANGLKLHGKGMPGNTMGGDEEGFGV